MSATRGRWRYPAGAAVLGGLLLGGGQAPVPAPASAPTPAQVVSSKGEQLGRIIDVLVDQRGHPRAAVIDFGGYMGIGNRKIAVDWKSLHFAAGKPDSPVVLDLTADQIKATPDYKEGASKPAAVAAPKPAATSPPAPAPSPPAPSPAAPPPAAPPPAAPPAQP
jgi:hypothetical protein